MIKPNYILTVTGNRIDFPVTKPENIMIDDIAWALSKAPRWCGHTDIPWTVAQHSILCTELARVEGGDVSPEILLQILIHDATEAFLGDLPSPVKERLPDYQNMEHDLNIAIHKALDVPVPQEGTPAHQILKHYDRLALLLEARDLFDRFPRNPWDFGVGRWPGFQSIFGYMFMFPPVMPSQEDIYTGFLRYHANLRSPAIWPESTEIRGVPSRLRTPGLRHDLDKVESHSVSPGSE